MTIEEKREKKEILESIHSDLRMLITKVGKSPKSSKGWPNIQARHQILIENTPELHNSIVNRYPNLFSQIKNLKQTYDIEKTMECLMDIVPSDD